MLSKFRKLPRRLFFLTHVRGYTQFRCEIQVIGYSLETDASRYPDSPDNSNRTPGLWVFQFTLAGEGRFLDRDTNTTYVLSPGRAFLAPFPSNTRYWLPTGASWEFVYLIFSGELAEYHARRLITAWGPVHDLPKRGGPISVMYEIYRAAVGGAAPDEHIASAALYRILMQLHAIRHTPAQTLPPAIERARRLIGERFADAGFGVDDMARHSGLSRYHFSRMFKKHLGVAPYAFLLRLRLKRAAELLTSTDEAAKRIALAVGFRDYAYFCGAFRERMGMTPGSLRRQVSDVRATHTVSE